MGGHERAHQADTGRGQERAAWALASVAEREPGTQKPPGWFVNRSQKIAADGSIVQTQTTTRVAPPPPAFAEPAASGRMPAARPLRGLPRSW